MPIKTGLTKPRLRQMVKVVIEGKNRGDFTTSTLNRVNWDLAIKAIDMFTSDCLMEDIEDLPIQERNW